MNTKHVSGFDLKSVTPAGTFSGILSPYGNVDLQGDVVEPGAYAKTLKERGNVVPLLWQHQSDVPIGQLTLQDSPAGLLCKGQLLMTLPDAQNAYQCIKSEIVRGLSVGFQSVRDSVVDGIRHLKEIKLYEGSLVTFGANELALISSVKTAAATPSQKENNIRLALRDFHGEVLRALGK